VLSGRTSTRIIGVSIALTVFIFCISSAFASEGNVDATNKYAWSENVGWQNYRPTDSGGYVNKNYLEGYIWCENAGWVRLGTGSGGVAGSPPQYVNTNATNYGVNNDGNGNLSGYAWSENAGWINFNPTHSQITIDTSTGEFDGYAWSENLGWIHVKNASPAYNVQTNWPTVTWDGSASGDWATGANWDSGVAPSSTDDVVIPDAATTPNDPTVSNGAVSANLTIQASGILNGGTNTLTVSGNWDNSGTFNSATGGVAFNATTGTITIDNNASSFNNISFDDSVGNATYQLIEATDVNGNFTLTDGIFDQNAKTLTVGGNWAFAGGSFLSAPSVTFDTQATETTISGETTFNNLSCATVSKTIKFTQGTNQTVNGTLTLTGGSGVGEKITLVSTVNTQKWDITFPNGTQAVSYVDVRDSDANTNIVSCYNSDDTGNNNANWVFSTMAITSPTAGKTIGTTPVVIGTAGAGDTVLIKDKDNTTVLTTTADANGNFRAVLTTPLGVSPPVNSLTPSVGGIPGATIANLTVSANPTTDQVPTIVSPAEDETVAGATPTIIGKGLANQVVTLTASDANGNLLLTDVATSTVDGVGNYTISSADYTTDLPGGTAYLTVTVGGVTSSITTVSFVDPFGIVFDTVTNNPIQGAVVTLWYQHPVAGWRQAVSGVDIGPGEVNPQTTGADGLYQYTVVHPPNTNLRLEIAATGYNFPTTKLPLAANFPTRTFDDTDAAVGDIFPFAGVVLNIDIPMDPDSQLLKITKDANKKDVVVGDIVTYTVTIQNPTAGDVTAVYIEDKIPAGFKYLKGKAILDGTQITDPTGNRPLTFNIGTVSSGQTRVLKYQLVVGSGVTFGKYKNIAFAKYADGTVISNTASETVKVIMDPLFDLGTVIGKVFWDWDENGLQAASSTPHAANVEPEAWSLKREAGIPNVRIVMEDGTVITTDKDGKYHVPGVIPGRHAFRLDEYSLPEDAYLTTRKVVIENVRPGLTSKVNFGVSAENGPQAIGDTPQIGITQEKEKPMPRLNIALYNNMLEVRDVGGLKELTIFKTFINYSLFVDKWQLDIYDKTTKKLFKHFEGKRENLTEPIYWNGKSDAGNFVAPDRTYTYVLTVWDKQGKFDRTREKVFSVSRYTPEVAHKKEELENEIFGEEKDKQDEKETFWFQQAGVNSLDTQTIPLIGETVKVASHKSYPDGYGRITSIRIIKDGKVEGDIPVAEGRSAVKELLESPQFEPESGRESESIDIIVPDGDYEIQVTSSAVTNDNPSLLQAPKFRGEAISGIASSPLAPRNDEGQEIYSKNIKVGEDYFFFVAMADGEMGYNFKSGNTEPVENDDHFKKGLWLEGKLAYYLKAKIKGKYFITSSLDTERDQKELFRYIDPDKYYPIYGDNSQVSYEATNTQGMLYALVEWDRSEVIYGNYNVAFTDTEFAQFSRTLYGGKAELISVSDTKFGEPNTKMIGFMAKAKQKAAHNEFIGTGGSLYYLKHKYVVEGSDKVKIEVRDKITGLVITTVEQKEGSDYQIDYDNGRIIFWKPVSQIVASDSIISSQLLDGNQLYVVADYEYYTKDKYDEWSKGARVSQQLGDYVRVGGTYVEDNNQSEKNYQLYGADTTVRLGDNIRLDAEYAETKSEEGNNFISTDGGLNFSELFTDEMAEGKAYGLSGEGKFFERLDVSGYYKMIEKGFSTSSTMANQGTEKIGGAVTFEIFPGTEVSARHDIQKLLDDGSLEARVQVGAEKTKTTTMQLRSQLTERLQATAEYRNQSVNGKTDEYESETNENANIVAGKLSYKLNDKTTVSTRYQESLSGERNRQGAVGAETMLTEHIGIRGEGILGSKGPAATAGLIANVQDRFDLFADYTISNESDTGLKRTATIGGKAKVDDSASLYNTYSVTDSGEEDKKETLAFGAKKELADGYEVTMGREFSKEGTMLATANTYGMAREIDGRRIESTFKQEESFESDGSKFLANIFGLSGDIDDKWAGVFNFEKGEVQNLDGTRTKRLAASAGASYVDKDKIKASSKLEFRHDDSSAVSQDSWQILAYNAIEAKPTQDLTLFAKANVSYTQNSSSDSTLASFKEMVLGSAYRPIYCDRLNVIGKYSYLEDESPASQEDYKDIDQIRAHVFGLEAVYDLTDKLQIVEKGAIRYMDEKVSGFGFTNTQTWLLVNRLNYNLTKDWELGGEYRILSVIQAKDYKQGALFEVSRRMGEYIKLGVGYNFTDFSDDLTDLDYTVHGPFVRMTGVWYDRSKEEIERAKKKKESDNIRVWAKEMACDEIAPSGSKTLVELNDCLLRAETEEEKGNLEESKALYEKIIKEIGRIREEAKKRVRNRVEWENKLKSYDELATIYYKEGKLTEAKELWQRVTDELQKEEI